MKPGFYRIRLTSRDGNTRVWITWARSNANAYWIASQIYESCQVEVLGIDKSI